jgi:amino acid adenylation domain-containing protein
MRDDNIEAIYPLSPLQQGMLFHTLEAPQSGMYFEQMSYTLSGDLHIPAFKQAWQQVIARHSILRTLFIWKNLARPQQIVRRQVSLAWREYDWRELSASDQQERLRIFLQQDQARGFNLAQAPLMRMALIHMEKHTYQFVWSFHHMLLDIWSRLLVHKEVSTYYEAFCQGQTVQLRPVRPYKDYITWVHQQDLQKAEVYWRQMLKGFRAATPLAVDRISHTGADQQKETDGQRIQLLTTTLPILPLQSLARQYQLTLNTLVRGAWAILLSRYSGEEDVVFGSVVSGRPASLKGMESMVGLFINTLPVRVQVSPQAPLMNWLQDLQNLQIEMHLYEWSPLMEIQKWSDVPRGQPLFESILVSVNYPSGDSFQERWGNLEIQHMQGIEGTSNPLTVAAVPGPEMLFGIHYERSRFAAEAITGMLGHLCTLLEGMVKDPRQRLQDVPLLTGHEHHQVLLDWNDTATAFPQDQCLHELFEARVRLTPGAVAAVCADQMLTYQALNQKANQLARYLQGLGVGPEILVGLCMQRSLELVVGLLGILKAGGAYMPLDPTYPAERLAFMLEDARVPVLLTQRHLLEGLPSCGAQVVCLDGEWATITGQSVENPASGVTPENLVYMIYTSGSTGRPKGIVLNHRGRVNNFCDFNRRFAVGAQDRLLALSSLSFDMAAYDVFGTLGAGGTLVLPPAWAERNPVHWAALLVQQHISVWHSVPALLQLLLEYIEGQPELAPRALRLALLGGDWIPLTLPDQLKALAAGVQVISLGGATEASMDSTIYPIEEINPGWKSIPYGKPMANQRCYVLDSHLRPVPCGVVGELHLAGIGLARGYLNCPDLTAQKFIPNPFRSAAGDRLYKTGDLVRYQPDGNLELLGRSDQQVKIRGVRIEPGEIEAALRRSADLQEALVVVREDEPGHRRLVAYIVPSPQRALDLSELREALKGQLPDSLQPAAFVVLDALPLTPNGKVARQNLPAPDAVRPQQHEAFVAPSSAVEKTLAGIWAQIFGLEQVSLYDNFFTLGGDSITSIRVIVRAGESGIQLTPRQIFQHQTIAELAVVASSSLPVTGGNGLQTDPGLDGGRDESYPLSPMQQNMLYQSLHAPCPGLYMNQASFSLPKNLEIAAWAQTWQYLTDRHAPLRTAFRWEGLEEALQVVHAHVEMPLDYYDWRELSADEQEARVRAFLQAQRARNFDLTKAPLVRPTVIRLGDDAYQFILINHYLLLDGWSIANLWKEALTYYDAFSHGREPEAGQCRPYRDYIAWTRQQDQFRAELFWRQTCKGFTQPALLERECTLFSNAQSYAKQAIRLSMAATDGLKALAKQQQLTVNTLVQGAWALLLSRYHGQPGVVFGVTSSGRPLTLAGVESMVGLFINTLPVHVQVLPEASLLPWLQGLQNQQLELRQYEYSSLLQIQNWSGLSGSKPLFESFLVFENYPIDLALRTMDTSLYSSHRLLDKDYSLSQTEFSLRVDISPQRELELSISYYRSRFADSSITQMLKHFQILLESIAANPRRSLNELILSVEPIIVEPSQSS